MTTKKRKKRKKPKFWNIDQAENNMANKGYRGLIDDVKGNLYGAMKKKEREGFTDCCEEYKFIRRSNTISFNNKMNRLGITHLVLDEKYNQTDVLMEDIIEPIKHGANTVFGVTGYTRSGKSELVQTIVLILSDVNKKHRGRDVEKFLCWTQPDFYLILMKLRKGDIVWRDEDPKPIGKGSRTETWAVDNVLHAIAKMENSFIFVDPKKIKVDICDLYLESAGMNRETRTNRFMIMDDEQQYFGHVYVKLHDNEELRAWYEKEKDIFIARTTKEGGKFKSIQEDVEIEEEELDEELQEEILVLEKIYKIKDEEREIHDRNIHIYKLRKQRYSFDTISNIVGLKKNSVETIYYNVKRFLKDNF